MNRYFTTFTLAMLFTASILTNSLAQSKWTKYTDNLVLDLSPSGEWDARNLSSGVYYNMIKDGAWQDVKKMVLLR